MSSALKSFLASIKKYFHEYGGSDAILLSPLFWIAILISMIGYGNWLSSDKWSPISQSVIPNLLGFSIGTYAIIFSQMTPRMKKALTLMKIKQEVTALQQINATFFHFIFIQILTLLWSFIYQSTIFSEISQILLQKCGCNRPLVLVVGGFSGLIGHVLLIYSITLLLGSALLVYRLASVVDPQDTGRQGGDDDTSGARPLSSDRVPCKR